MNKQTHVNHPRAFSKMLSILVTLTMLLSILPAIPVSATPKLNYTEKMITVGQSFTLKVSPKKKNVKWTSTKPSVATVSKSGKVHGKSRGTAVLTAKIGKKSYKCKVYVNTSISSAISEINNWLTGSIWNEGFCDFGWYYSNGTNNCGQKMNIQYSVNKFKKNYKKFNLYEDYIISLKGSKYSSLKESWKYMRNESDTLYKKVTNEIDWSSAPYDDDKFNNDLFQQYFNDVYKYLVEFSYS